MAEFQDVIIQMKRMCAHFSPTCNGCKLCMGKGTSEFCGEEPKDIRSHPALVEAAVMRWAKDHPEPVYPTWADWMYDNFLIWCQNKYPGRMKDAEAWFDYLYETPIPADIAKKLGVKPKEG